MEDGVQKFLLLSQRCEHQTIELQQSQFSSFNTSIFLIFSRAEIDSNANADASQMDRKYVFGLQYCYVTECVLAPAVQRLDATL